MPPITNHLGVSKQQQCPVWFNSWRSVSSCAGVWTAGWVWTRGLLTGSQRRRKQLSNKQRGRVQVMDERRLEGSTHLLVTGGICWSKHISGGLCVWNATVQLEVSEIITKSSWLWGIFARPRPQNNQGLNPALCYEYKNLKTAKNTLCNVVRLICSFG